MVSTFSDVDSSSAISSCNGLFSTTVFVDFPYLARTDTPHLSFPIISFSITPFFQFNRVVGLFSFISTTSPSLK